MIKRKTELVLLRRNKAVKINDVYSVIWSQANQAYLIMEFQNLASIRESVEGVADWLIEHKQIVD